MNKAQQWSTRALGAGLLAWMACTAADESARETREISQPFNEVRLAGDIDLELSQGDSVSLVIEAPKDELPSITSEIKDGVMTLRRSNSGAFSGLFSKHHPARALLTAKTLDRLDSDGSGSLHAADWTTQALHVRSAGSGDAKFERLTGEGFRCEMNGSGNVSVAGSVSNQRIRVSGSGSYRAAGLKSEAAVVTVLGSGTAELWAARTLEARVLGSGDVQYYGAPTVTKSVAGSGSVMSMGEKVSPVGEASR
jgi:hypothetical protein